MTDRQTHTHTYMWNLSVDSPLCYGRYLSYYTVVLAHVMCMCSHMAWLATAVNFTTIVKLYWSFTECLSFLFPVLVVCIWSFSVVPFSFRKLLSWDRQAEKLPLYSEMTYRCELVSVIFMAWPWNWKVLVTLSQDLNSWGFVTDQSVSY